MKISKNNLFVGLTMLLLSCGLQDNKCEINRNELNGKWARVGEATYVPQQYFDQSQNRWIKSDTTYYENSLTYMFFEFKNDSMFVYTITPQALYGLYIMTYNLQDNKLISPYMEVELSRYGDRIEMKYDGGWRIFIEKYKDNLPPSKWKNWSIAADTIKY
jgi:hypothetical protein